MASSFLGSQTTCLLLKPPTLSDLTGRPCTGCAQEHRQGGTPSCPTPSSQISGRDRQGLPWAHSEAQAPGLAHPQPQSSPRLKEPLSWALLPRHPGPSTASLLSSLCRSSHPVQKGAFDQAHTWPKLQERNGPGTGPSIYSFESSPAAFETQPRLRTTSSSTNPD